MQDNLALALQQLGAGLTQGVNNFLDAQERRRQQVLQDQQLKRTEEDRQRQRDMQTLAANTGLFENLVKGGQYQPAATMWNETLQPQRQSLGMAMGPGIAGSPKATAYDLENMAPAEGYSKIVYDSPQTAAMLQALAGIEPAKPIEVSPGASLYDPRSRQSIFTAPMDPYRVAEIQSRVALNNARTQDIPLDTAIAGSRAANGGNRGGVTYDQPFQAEDGNWYQMGSNGRIVPAGRAQTPTKPPSPKDFGVQTDPQIDAAARAELGATGDKFATEQQKTAALAKIKARMKAENDQRVASYRQALKGTQSGGDQGGTPQSTGQLRNFSTWAGKVQALIEGKAPAPAPKR